MLAKQVFQSNNPDVFKQKALHWAAGFETACFLDSNSYRDAYHQLDTLIAAGAEQVLEAHSGDALQQLDEFIKGKDRFIPGFISYDLKNEVEKLESDNPDGLHFPDLYFFIPKHQILIKGEAIEITSENPVAVFEAIQQTPLQVLALNFRGELKARFSRDEYLQSIKELQLHIRRGDIYEINFCQEFYAENAEINPIAAFTELNRISPTPFANFFKIGQKYIISATPERFLSRKQNVLISQPIKGTARRSKIKSDDELAKIELAQSEKERSENVMIVDLVRNDLTKCAIPGTVKVEELFGIYSFEQVHQMISTISCQVEANTKISSILKATFPMGSMTGAPKIKAMQLIEQFERTKRGLYSGSVGYFQPNGDFDFNVIIRTLLYNAENQYLSYQVGGAITHQANAEQEYEECMLKAQAIRQLLGQ